MNEKKEMTAVEIDGVEMADLGDAMVETRQQHPIQTIADSAITWTWFAE